LNVAAVVPATNPRRLTWEQVKALVLDSVTSPHSKRAYARAISEFVRWAGEQQTAGQGSPFGKALIPVVISTAFAEEKIARRVRDLPAGFIQKPFALAPLLRVISRVLKR
jgi:hypothetical protein